MNATWNPQTKKPAVSRPYPRWPAASRTAAASDCPGSASAGPVPAGASEAPGSSIASGAMTSTEADRPTSAGCHPQASMNPCPIGEKATCPNEPAAVPRPRASERRSGPTTFAMAARAMVNAVQATPTPTSTPAVACSRAALSAYAIPRTPSA